MDCETCIHECVCMYDGTRTSVDYCSFYEMQRLHGEWITKKDSLQTYCSHCDTAIPYSDEYDFSDFIFCPYCGADMRKEGGEK